jgi:putative selenium metabolism protein SsnA
MTSLLIKNGVLVTEPLLGTFRSGDLRIEDGRISQIGADLPAGSAEVIDARGEWVVPGLIDAHTHLYGALANGMPGPVEPPQNFPQILERIWWRLDKALSADDIGISGLLGAVASLKNGVTTIFDHHASPTCVPGSLDILSEAVGRVGLRASLAYEVSDRDGAVSRDQGIEENFRFIQVCQRNPDPLRKAHFGLHAVFSLSDETLRHCAEIGGSLGVGFHLHVVEHRTELEKFRSEHQGENVVHFLSRIGILSPRTIAAHVVHVDGEDIASLAKSGTWTVHNPKSNMGNGVGVSPVKQMLEAGVTACLGSDGFYDLPRQMELAPLLQNLHQGNPSFFGTGSILRMVYQNNAGLAEQTFGMPFGKLAVGYAADCLVIPYEPETPVNAQNFASHLMLALLSGPSHAIVGGLLRLENGELPGLDIQAIRARSRELAGRLWERL